jgi:hypothetical protein
VAWELRPQLLDEAAALLHILPPEERGDIDGFSVISDYIQEKNGTPA